MSFALLAKNSILAGKNGAKSCKRSFSTIKYINMEQEILYIKKLSKNATTPVRGSPNSAGYDLFSAVDVTIASHGKALIQTDLSVAIPKNCYGRVAPRSGLAWKNFIDVGAGVIDCDYRGSIGVILFNFSDADFQIKKGDRIAQFILERICMAPIMEVDSLDDTERGTGGFGSTGMNDIKK